MVEALVETKKTTPTKLDFARALLAVWPDASKEGAGVLWAHFAGETGDGAYCWNWNLGNVKHVKGDGHNYVSLRGVWEGFKVTDLDGDGDVDADDRVMLIERLLASGMWAVDENPDHQAAVGPGKVSMVATPGNAATWFRAYRSLAEGMTAFVEMKRRQGGRYSSAWIHVEAGDPERYARELGHLGYYTASPDVYARAMRKKFDAWMVSTDFEQAQDETPTDPRGEVIDDPNPTPRVSDHPIAPLAVVTSNGATLAGSSELVPIELDGVTWLVCPIYVAPIGIGEAIALAEKLGFELPTPALVDAIWRAADLRVPPHLMIRAHDGTPRTMDSPEVHAEQARVLEAYVGPRSLGVDYKLLAGAFKDVVRVNDKVGIYGWHCDEAGATKLRAMGIFPHEPNTPGDGLVVQPPFTGHARAWRDYSQGLRLVRRA